MKRLSVTLNEEYLFENYQLTNYSVNQPTAPKLRSSIIDWLFVINRTLSDTPYTFFHAMKIFNEVVMMSVAFVSKNILKNKYTSNDVI